MKKLLFAGLFLTAATYAVAQQNLEANWQGYAIDGQHRTVTDNSNANKDLAIVGAGSFFGDVTNSSLTVDNKNISINTPGAAASTQNPTGSKGAYVAGGAVQNATASGNTLNLSNLTGGNELEGRDAIGGAAVLRDPLLRAANGSAVNNTVNLNNVTIRPYILPVAGTSGFPIGGNVYGGFSEYSKGSASGNAVNITNGSVIYGNVYGGKIEHHLNDDDLKEEGVVDSKANNNRVTVKDSTVIGTVAGAAGAATSDGNIVIVDHSTAGNVYAVDQSHGIEDSDESITHADNNTVIVRGGSTIIGNAAAVNTTSVNASGNTLSIEDSTVNAQNLYAVNMGLTTAAQSGNPVKATVGNNTLALSSLGTASLEEAGASLNLVGDASGNRVQISNTNLTLNNTSGKFFSGKLDAAALEANNLLTLPSDKGILFGGATMTYTSQTNTKDSAAEDAPEEKTIATYGTTSNNNIVSLSGGTVSGNVIGGFAAYVEEKDYWTKTETEATEEAPASTTYTHVVKNGLDVITTIDPTPEGGQPEPELGKKKDDLVFSASNNTIVLNDVTFDGKIYGGYVDGAELTAKNQLTQNNTVVLRGNISLSDDSVISGGNNELYKSTNHLVFDRTKATFTNSKQFQNFNQMWNINADYDTKINFNFDGVYATMTVDPSAMKEGQAVVVTTQTATDLKDIQQGDKVVDLTDSGITLANNKLGVYSFDLSGIKENSNTVGWQLTGTKETANLEVYGQLPLVGLALAMEGQEMMSTAITDAWKNENEYSSFLNGAYHHTRYKTGSGFDLDSGIFQAGAWKKLTNDWLAGFFVKYAHGSYETFPIKVDGDADVYGGGLLTSLRYSETGRLEVDAEVGYMDMDFNSSELGSVFKTKGMYYGVGAGFVETLLEDFDLFANLRYLHKGEDDLTDNLGQTIEYEAMKSLALRFGGEYTFSQLDLYGLKPALGVMGIYEMDGKSSVQAEGIKTDEASLKGMSGRAQLSLVYQNKDTFLPLRTALTVYGMAGKREGVGGEVNIAFEF